MHRGPTLLADGALLLAGVFVLVFAADRMVLASAALARRWGLSPVIVGALIIGFGSSLPEMLVSTLSLDQPNGLDLAIGNVVGSNIANIALVLGVSVAIFPIRGQAGVIKREGVVMFGAMVLLSAILWDLRLSFVEAMFLLGALGIAAALVLRWSASEGAVMDGETASGRSIPSLVVAAVLSLVAVVAGARATVVGAENIALELGLAEGVVGLTILALGTSLPELGTVLASARRGHTDLILGNVLGSNIFNALAVAGIVGSIGGGALVTDFRADLVMMVAVAGVAGWAAWSGNRLTRIEGVILALAYPAAVVLAL